MLYGLTLSPVWKCCDEDLLSLFTPIPSGIRVLAAVGLTGNHFFHKEGGGRLAAGQIDGRRGRHAGRGKEKKGERRTATPFLSVCWKCFAFGPRETPPTLRFMSGQWRNFLSIIGA